MKRGEFRGERKPLGPGYRDIFHIKHQETVHNECAPEGEIKTTATQKLSIIQCKNETIDQSKSLRGSRVVTSGPWEPGHEPESAPTSPGETPINIDNATSSHIKRHPGKPLLINATSSHIKRHPGKPLLINATSSHIKRHPGKPLLINATSSHIKRHPGKPLLSGGI